MPKSLIQAGDLNRRVTIERAVLVQDPGSGAYSTSWETLATVWAEVQDVLPARAESVANNLNLSRRPARVRMRYRDDLDSTMRLFMDGRTLNIISGPAEIGLREGIEFVAEQLSTQGDG